MKVCAEPGCPVLTLTGPRCHACTRAKDKARGTRQQRGYGKTHDKLRNKWAPKVAAGTVNCWRCGQRISPLDPWDLGHDDTDRSIWRGPECLPCNRGTRRTPPPPPTDPAGGGG